MTENQRDYTKAGMIVGALLLAGVLVNLFAIKAARSEPGNQWDLLAHHAGGVTDMIGHHYARASRGDVHVVGGRPAACFKFRQTARRYCGCASALKVGLPNSDGRWNLARRWYEFPRAQPGPMMALVRPNHVSIIIGGSPGAWRIYDPNSGGGLTRVYTTSRLRGTVVNPRVRVAEAR